MIEIYMEQIRDLLTRETGIKYVIHEDPKRGLYIENLTEKCVSDELEVE